MLLIEAKNIKKDWGDRRILDFDALMVYQGDRVGIVGANGVGKTTLLNILTGIDPDFEGEVRLHGSYSYIRQLEEQNPQTTLSGGEQTKKKIQQSLDRNPLILFADEPTSHLDMAGIQLLESQLKEFSGALMVISHDRHFLDQICNRIIEIEDGALKEYRGNYSHYVRQRREAFDRRVAEYEAYIKERNRLMEAKDRLLMKSRSVNKAPKRMGNSEARLHRMVGATVEGRLARNAKVIQSRIEQLEVKEKPKELPRVNMALPEEQQLGSKRVIQVQDLSFGYGEELLFKNLNFEVKRGEKVALVGDNGTGKTTLTKLILAPVPGIYVTKGAKIGYFRQDLSDLQGEKTILENLMESSIYSETFVRIILARLLIKGEAVYKPVKVLSGGERVKVQLAKLFTSDFNLLILDEPGNFLDLYSKEALEEVMKEYEGTLLFISHDRYMIDQVADRIIHLTRGKWTAFEGNYSQYLQWQEEKSTAGEQQLRERLLQLEVQLSQLIGKLSIPDKKQDKAQLEQEYQRVLEEIQHLKKALKGPQK